MTDRYAGFLVALARDIREDDAEAVMAAMRLFPGVLAVTPVPSHPDMWIAEDRARADLQRKLFEIVKRTSD